MMSISENELSTIKECMQQLRNCSEFLLESVDKIENDIKDFTINSDDNKTEHSKDYERIRRSLRKVYKETKQRIHDIGKDSKELDSINMDATSVTEEDLCDDKSNHASSSDKSQKQNNISTENGKRSESVVSNGFENQSLCDEVKPKIRLVAIGKLLDPKVFASTTITNQRSPIVRNTSSSIIVLDSDDESPDVPAVVPTVVPAVVPAVAPAVVPAVVPTLKISVPTQQRLPRTRKVKVRVKRNRAIEQLVKRGKRVISVSQILSSKNSNRLEDDTDVAPSTTSRSRHSHKNVDKDKPKRSHREEFKRAARKLQNSDEESSSTEEMEKIRKTRKGSLREPKKNNIILDSNSESSDEGLEKSTLSQRKSKEKDKGEKSSEEEDSSHNKSPSKDESGEESDVITRKKKRNSDGENEKDSDWSESSLALRKPKRRRIRRNSSGSESSKNSDDDFEYDSEDSDGNKKKKKKTKQKRKGKNDKSDEDEDEETKRKRKNIRNVIKTKNLVDETKKAAEAEKSRLKRIEERQKLYNQIFEKPESTEIDKMVLDFDEETKEELLSVDKGLLKKMKPHQVQGVRFMWDACFETIKDIKDKEGSGCILGHCMGLGKTLQIVALTHTLLTNSRKTHIETVLVITPLSTVTNWAREFYMWLRYCKKKDVEVYDMSKFKEKKLRQFKLNEWHEEGGVCILGYDMYRILTNPKMKGGKKMIESLQRTLVDPGPDMIVCDEGHLLKNEKTSISQAVTRVRTKRRIVLSGTPLQNNLKEYYCMVQFVKPNLLGTYKEYLNRFVNPITNGQYTDSTDRDIRLMKHRSHVLHKMLDGCIQRRDYSVLAPYLPPKHEYVVFIALSDLQKKLYEHYMTKERSNAHTDAGGKGTALFRDFQNLRRLWTHPMSLRVNSEDAKKKRERKALDDDENSLDDFIVDETSSESEKESATTDSDSDDEKSSKRSKSKKGQTSRRTRQNRDAAIVANMKEAEDDVVENEWWMSICAERELRNVNHSPKLLLLFEILQECEAIGDKVLLFSQSLQSLRVIEEFLALIDRKTRSAEKEGEQDFDVNGFSGSWISGVDYFRLDGSNTIESREHMCKRFNNTSDLRARLFLISTRAGSLGINLVAANRVIIFDASWNPSHDTQSIFRVYRFGQNKPCYIYRFIAYGTMEAKIYERQVTKQATAKRVIDEQQIGRHYNSNDLLELYQYELEPPEAQEVPLVPKDRLFADMIRKNGKLVVKYHEHDSLLENKESENLNEEERKAAWAEYENEKNAPAASTQYLPYVRPNYRNGPVTSSKIFGFRSDVLLQLLNLRVRRDFPTVNNADVAQLVPNYLRRLYEEMNNGNGTLYNELVELHNAFETPMGLGINPMGSNFIVNPFFQQPPTQNMEPAYIHEID